MELTDLERAQIIIDTLKNRVFQLEDQLLSEQSAHRMSQASYQKAHQNSQPEETGGAS